MSSEAPSAAPETKSMSIIVTKGSLDWAYPPFILATTAAAMGLNVTLFFTFYGLPLLLKKLNLQVTAAGNPAMKMQSIVPLIFLLFAVPGVIYGYVAGVFTTSKDMVDAMTDLFGPRRNGRSPQREMAVEADVRMIACQMTMDLFEYDKEDMIEGIDIGGAATYIECATQSDINLFV